MVVGPARRQDACGKRAYRGNLDSQNSLRSEQWRHRLLSVCGSGPHPSEGNRLSLLVQLLGDAGALLLHPGIELPLAEYLSDLTAEGKGCGGEGLGLLSGEESGFAVGLDGGLFEGGDVGVDVFDRGGGDGDQAGVTQDAVAGGEVALIDLPGLHLIAVERGPEAITVEVESAPGEGFCPDCGVLAYSHGRRSRVLHDIPFGDTTMMIVWRTRTWRCAEPLCGKGTFTEQAPALAAPARC